MLILLGFGITNRAIAESYAPTLVFDDAFKTLSYDTLGNALYPSAYLTEILSSHLDATIITSPGIPPYNPMLKIAQSFVVRNPKMQLLSEYDFFAQTMPASVWISGTNGKTTTTQMLTYLASAFGAVSGGNIGTPLAKLDSNAPLWVLETSSFTLHYTHIAKPILYLLLPLSQDHISWHSSYENYINDKLKPVFSLKEKEIAILPKNLECFCKESYAHLIFYENAQDLAKQFNLDISRIHFKAPFLLDATLALCAMKILYQKHDYALLNSFKIGAHKMEEFKDRLGNLWIDDSKGTNIDATMEALKCYKDKEILLIVGGDDKGTDLNPLFTLMQNLQVEIFSIGSNSDKICTLAKTYQLKAHICLTLEVAVKHIKEALKTRKNAVALLSPAAASLDQFSSYKERGEKFKAYVLA